MSSTPNSEALSREQRELLELLLKKEGLDPRRLPIPRRGSSDRLPLSLSQERLWFLEQLEPRSGAYNVPVAFRLTGALDVEALRLSLREVVLRHEVLRTTFPVIDGEPIQAISEEARFIWTVADLRSIPAERRIAEASRRISEEARRPFDLARGPLVRGMVLQLGPEEHDFLLATHHFVVDGWSLTVLFTELAACYEAFRRGQSPLLPPLAIQYADFALWQRNQFPSNELEGQLDYWREQLSGVPLVLELPTDHSRPAVWSSIGACHTFALPRSLSDAIERLCRQEGLTPYMMLLAAFQILFHLYTDQEHFVVGTPVSERSRIGTEGVVGPFTNLLLMRGDFSGSPTVREFLGRVRESALGAYAHQDVPFEMLVEDFQPERDLSRNALVQAILVLHQRSLAEVFRLAGARTVRMPVDLEASRFDISIDIETGQEGLTGSIEYSTALFDATTIERMVGHLQMLLQAMSADPTRPLSDLPILTDVERKRLLGDWNRTGVAHSEDGACAQHLIEARCRENPDAIAASLGEESLTYGELDRRANRLARQMINLGVVPGTLVGICLDPSFEMVVAILGVWKAGAAYVPLDPMYPRERLSFMLEDSGVRLVLTRSGLAELLPERGVSTLRLDEHRGSPSTEEARAPDLDVTDDNLAYVIYTSGSTGKPKGVAISHAALVNLLCSVRREPGFSSGDTLLAVTTLSFDIAGLELWLPLSVGGRVALTSREQASDPRALIDLLARVRPNLMQATPATWRMLLDAGWSGDPRLTVLCGGEALTRDLADRLLGACGTVWNMYGPTETTIYSTASRVAPGDEPILIGRPLANTKVYVLDTRRRLVPIGVPGELYIGGRGLAQGYWGRPELTGERFVLDPFSGDPASRLYRTGDLVRFRMDGNLECFGRLDNQVKIRGFRIELGEIESVLMQHPAVREAAVAVKGTSPEDRHLVAYWVSRDGKTTTARELRTFLKKLLPDYMIPAFFLALESLPRTPNSKLDRRALPSPDQNALPPERSIRAPRDAVELWLTQTWENLLHVRPIAPDDDFFELGGQSFLAARLFARMEAEFGRRFPLATLFQAPTIEKLAKVMQEEDWVPPWSSIVDIQRGDPGVPPLYLVHWGGGHVLHFGNLARRMNPSQPIIGLQSPALSGERTPRRRIEDMAADSLADIRKVQPHGPYFLGGASAGGIVALEIASQLLKLGERIGLLAIFDTRLPEIEAPDPIRQRVQTGLKRLSELSVSERTRFVSGLVRHSAYRVWRGGLRLMKRFVEKRPGVLLREAEHLARRRYKIRPYPGQITLFRAAAEVNDSGMPDLGWGRWSQMGVEVIEIPGGHLTMLEEPHVSVLAEKLAECISRAQWENRTS